MTLPFQLIPTMRTKSTKNKIRNILKRFPPTHFPFPSSLFHSTRTSKPQAELQLFSRQSSVCWPDLTSSTFPREKMKMRSQNNNLLHRKPQETWQEFCYGTEIQCHKTFLSLAYHTSARLSVLRWPFLIKKTQIPSLSWLLFYWNWFHSINLNIFRHEQNGPINRFYNLDFHCNFSTMKT